MSPDIIISGIPASVTDSPRTMVLKVFDTLGISELAVNVLDVRCLTEKDGSVIGDCQCPSAAGGASLPFIVTLKSLSIRDHIVSRKRQIKNLTLNKVFGGFGGIINPAPLGKRVGNRRTKPDPPGQALGRITPRFELPLNSDEHDGNAHSVMSNRLAMGRTGPGWFPNNSVPGAADSRYRVRPSEADLQFSDDEVELRPIRALTAVTLLNTMKRWDLSFSGRRGEDVEDFLTRIDEGRAFLPVRDAELIKAVPFFLRAAALVWYRGHAHEFSTWENAKLAFRRYYSDPDYQIALREEIADCTQAEGEQVGDYVACMRGLFSRTSPRWSEREEVRYTHRNLLAEYRPVVPLTDQTTMDQLETTAIRHGRVFESMNTRRPPLKPEHSLCPSFAYKGDSPAFRSNRRPFVKAHAALEGEGEVAPVDGEPDLAPPEYLDAARQYLPRRGNPTGLQPARNPATKLAWRAVLPEPPPATDQRRPQASHSSEPDASPLRQRRSVGETGPRTSHPENSVCWNCQKRGHRPRATTCILLSVQQIRGNYAELAFLQCGKRKLRPATRASESI